MGLKLKKVVGAGIKQMGKGTIDMVKKFKEDPIEAAARAMVGGGYESMIEAGGKMGSELTTQLQGENDQPASALSLETDDEIEKRRKEMIEAQRRNSPGFREQSVLTMV